MIMPATFSLLIRVSLGHFMCTGTGSTKDAITLTMLWNELTRKGRTLPQPLLPRAVVSVGEKE